MRRLFRGRCLFKEIRCEDSCTNCPKYLSRNLLLWLKRYKVVNVLNEIFYTAKTFKVVSTNKGKMIEESILVSAKGLLNNLIVGFI